MKKPKEKASTENKNVIIILEDVPIAHKHCTTSELRYWESGIKEIGEPLFFFYSEERIKEEEGEDNIKSQ